MRRFVVGLVIATGCAQAGAVSGDSQRSQYSGRFRWMYDNGIAAAGHPRQNPQPIDTPNPPAMSATPTAVAGSVRFCVGPTGSVNFAETEAPTGDARLDAALRDTVKAWTFRPAEFGGLRVDACSTATFMWSLR